MDKKTNGYFGDKNKIIIILSWLLVVLWAGVIFYLSSKSAPESTVQSNAVINSFNGIFGIEIPDELEFDKVSGIVRETAHGVEYFILGALVFNAIYLCLNYRKQEELLLEAETGIKCRDPYRMLNSIVCAITICTLYALSDEIHQIPIPGRAFQIMDLTIDFIGIILGVIFVAVLYKIKKKPTTSSYTRQV